MFDLTDRSNFLKRSRVDLSPVLSDRDYPLTLHRGLLFLHTLYLQKFLRCVHRRGLALRKRRKRLEPYHLHWALARLPMWMTLMAADAKGFLLPYA